MLDKFRETSYTFCLIEDCGKIQPKNFLWDLFTIIEKNFFLIFLLNCSRFLFDFWICSEWSPMQRHGLINSKEGKNGFSPFTISIAVLLKFEFLILRHMLAWGWGLLVFNPSLELVLGGWHTFQLYLLFPTKWILSESGNRANGRIFLGLILSRR